MTKDSPQPRLRARRIVWALPVLGLLVGLAILEAGMRVYFRKESHRMSLLQGDVYYYHELGGARRHIPGRVGRGPHWDNKGMVEYRVNARGFLDDPLADPKPAGEKRILFLGDSIVMAGRIHRKDTFVEKAEVLLSGGASPVEVINAGVGDAGLEESLAVLKREGFGVRPDLVVLGVYLNDSRPPEGFRDENLYEHPVVRTLRTNALLRRSYLANYLVFKAYHLFVARHAAKPSISRRLDWVAEYKSGAWVTDAESLKRMVSQARWDWGAAWVRSEMAGLIEGIEAHRKLCAERDVPFAVVLFPVKMQLLSRADWDGLRRPQKALRHYLSEAKVPHLDMLEVLYGRDIAPLYYDQCHFNPAGHVVAAEALAPFLREALGT